MFLAKYDDKIINIPYRNVYQRTWKLVDCKIYNSSTRGKSIQNQSTTPFGRCGLTLDWFTTREIVIDFAIHQLLGPLITPIQNFWSQWITLVYQITHTDQSNEAFKALFSTDSLSFFPSEQLFSWLISIDIFFNGSNQSTKKTHTQLSTVGKVGSKREAENKTAPLSIFCHLLPWDIIMHRQWRRKTIICQVLCSR